MTLELPCADGTLASAGSTQSATPVEDVAAVDDSTPTSTRRVEIKLVTGDDYAPYTDEDAAGGGVITELLRQALATVETDADTSITFINDWGSHMDILLPSGAFDGTFPWVAPDCEASDLSESFQTRGENFRFAEPVYEIVTGIFAPADDPLATTASYSDFEGKTICIPEGYGAFVMPSGGVAEEDVVYSNPKTPEACSEELMAGSVDAIEMELRQAADIANMLNLNDKFAVNDNISAAVALTVVVDKDNPDGDEIIGAINAGIVDIDAVDCEGEDCPQQAAPAFAFGGKVTLIGDAGRFEGILTDIVDGAYVLDSEAMGVLRVSADTFTCEGDGCP